MRQTRISIGCRDWQSIIEAIAPEAAGVLLYLTVLMRAMQSAEISVRITELASSLHLSDEATETALASIQAAGLLTRHVDASGMITLRSDEEEKRQNEARRKRAARLLSRFGGQSNGQSGDTFFDKNGQSADSPKEVYSEVMMVYDPNSAQEKSHTLFNHTGRENKKEKNPPTPKKEKSLTERQRARTRDDSPELPVDQLEVDYIDVVTTMQPSLRAALRSEESDVREAFYLYCRKKYAELGPAWTADRMRVTWLAARRIPSERRADSILAAYLGGWKTIRDCGSGVYFDKSTGRVMSLVRGPVQEVGRPKAQPNAVTLGFLKQMREE